MILEALLLGVCAWVFVFILMDDGMILSWWGKVINRLPEWLSEPLGGCEYCVAGQMALWYYFYRYWTSYDAVEQILFITLTIFFVDIINTWKQK